MKKLLASIISILMFLFVGVLNANASSLLIYNLHGEAESFTGYTAYLQSIGWKVDTVSSEITLELLREYDVFIVGGYRTPYRFPEDAIDDVVSYVEEGGGLWVLGDYHQEGSGFNDNSLSSRFGVNFNDDTVVDPTNYQDHIFWPIIHNLESHPITNGISSYVIHAGCSLNVDNSNHIIARGDNDTYSDSYTSYPPVLAALEIGNGRTVFTVSSYALHSSVFPVILSNEERRLLTNIAEWLAEDVIYLFVTDLTDRVNRYNGETGEFIDIFVDGSEYDIHIFPFGLVFDYDSNLYVTDTNNGVARFNGTTGEFIDVFASGGGTEHPQDLVFGPDGNLYVSNSGTDNVLRYNGTSGAFIDVFANGNGLSFPMGLAFGPDGNLYVANSGMSNVLRLNGTTGAFIDIFTSGHDMLAPLFLTFSPSKHISNAPKS